MKNRLGILSVLICFLSSCGNPHLIESDENKQVIKISEPQTVEKIITVKQIEVVNSDGGIELRFGQIPINIDNKKILIIQNTTDKELPIELKFDHGLNFYFSGGSFPGINGTCPNVIQPKSKCQIEIEFQATIIGIFEDYLHIRNGQENTAIPLSGERKEGNKDCKSEKLIFNKNLLGTTFEFGEVTIGSSSKKEVEINNLTENSVKIADLKIVGSDNFKIVSNGACQTVVPKSGCTLEISYNPTEGIPNSAKLQIKDQDQNILNLELKGKGITAPVCLELKEKIVKAQIERKSNSRVNELPYLSSAKGTNAVLSTLYGTDFNVQVKGVSIRTVKDAMVLADFDLSVVPFEKLKDIKVDLDVWKIIADDYKDTEMLCLTSKSFKRCSGRNFTLEKWKKLLNSKFWSKGKLVNTLFETKLNATEKKCGDTTCEVLRDEMSFKELFDLSREDLEILKNDKIITLVLSDDSRFLSLPKLQVQSEVQVNCSDKE
jgi:hypothetical protein